MGLAESILVPLQSITVPCDQLLIRPQKKGVVNDYQLINTINNAAFNPNPLSETQPRCLTGNCTWPLFTSLRFCFKCQDISQPLRNSSTCIDKPPKNYPCYDPNGPNVQNMPNVPNSVCKYITRNYTYRFPELNGQVLEADFDRWLPGLGPVRSFFSCFNISFRSRSPWFLPAFFVTTSILCNPVILGRHNGVQFHRWHLGSDRCFNYSHPNISSTS